MNRQSLILPAGLAVFIVCVAGYFYWIHHKRPGFAIPSFESMRAVPEDLEELASRETDFEADSLRQVSKGIVQANAHSGNFVQQLDSTNTTGYGFSGRWKDVYGSFRLRELRFSAWMRARQQLENVFMVFEIDSGSGPPVYTKSEPVSANAGPWTRISTVFTIPLQHLNPAFRYKVYVRNQSGKPCFIDDMELTLYGFSPFMSTLPGPVVHRNEIIDFESEGDLTHLDSTRTHRGKYAMKLDAGFTYSSGIARTVHEVSKTGISMVTVGAWICAEEENPDALIVVTLVKPDGNEYLREERSTKKGIFPVHTWTKHRAQFKLPEAKIGPDDKIIAYVWNKGGTRLLVDDIEVVYGAQQARAGGDPLLDATDHSGHAYDFSTNAPPFKTVSMIPAGDWATDSGNEPAANLSSGNEKLVAGRFIASGSGIQACLVAEHECRLVAFCTKHRKTETLVSGKVADAVLPDGCIAADLDRDGADELYLLTKNRSLAVLRVPGTTPQCTDESNSGDAFLQSVVELPTMAEWDPGTCMLLAAPGGNDLFLIDRSRIRSYRLSFEHGQFIWTDVKWQFENPGLSVQQAFWGAERRMYVVFSDSGRKRVRVFHWNEMENRLTPDKLLAFPPLYLFEKSARTHPAIGATGTALILEVHVPHFALMHLVDDKDGLRVVSGIEFRNTPPDRNPKFAESFAMAAGTFVPDSTFGLLTLFQSRQPLVRDTRAGRQLDSRSHWGLFKFK